MLKTRPLLTLLLLSLLSWQSGASMVRNLPLGDGGEMPLHVYPGRGDTLFLLMPLEFGPVERVQPLATALSEAGHETWTFDPFINGFLDPSTQNMDKVPAGDIAKLIEYAHAKSGKQVIIIAAGRGAVPALRGVRQWQVQNPRASYYRGTILLHPKLLAETPAPGETARYMPISYASSLPLYLISPSLSPGRWRIMEQARVLETGGSPVYVQVLDNVRDFFFVHTEEGFGSEEMTAKLPHLLISAQRLLLSETVSHRIAALPEVDGKPHESRGLSPYKGKPEASELVFDDTHGVEHRLSAYRGKVVLLNFWATWCPPCVHEMPSMQQLADALQGQPFTILAVNMAEKPQEVRDFLKRAVHVRFPVLLDSEGLALKDWPVYVFPTSYLIDKQGRIRYAMYGALEWNTPRVQTIIRQLMAE